ncbi:hypothetical protein ALI22I_26465 [Saccharothrix sp. ALI-22-I]|uniref:MFS transporter n=1 Tax=Saccharothrix sp. ALI-22-I TaxID=1933778 RepID=UPI00097C8CA5|nr:MFS transporter [Saccharothrix sp. ALI-22-I]ONI86237.1 hypothetical protein ALI22I_26465 [Saccharothrix sp. ALI-22-I]
MSRSYGFGVLLAATACSDAAGGIFATAAVLVAATTSADPGAVSAVGVAAGLPWLLAGVPVGVLADAFDRRRLMVAANTCRAVAMAGLAAVTATGAPTLAVLLAAVFVVGLLQVVVDTCAEASVPALVAAPDRTRANGALTVATRITNQFAGPVFAGTLLALGASVPSLVAGAVCGAAALAVLIGHAQPTPQPTPRPTPIRARVTAGMGDILRDPVLRGLALVSGATTFANAAFLTALVLYAVPPGPLNLTTTQYGVVVGAIGLGATVGSLLTARLEALVGRQHVLWLSRVGWAAVFLAPLTGEYTPLLAVAALGSVLGGMWAVMALSVRQTVVPRSRLGRVSGAYRTATHGATPLGAAAGGGAVALWGPPTVFTAAGIAMTLLIIPLRMTMTERDLVDAERRRHGN